jgi:hypothetical protein
MTELNTDDLDWDALRRIRSGFLDGTAGTASYWTSDSDLDSYDRTFGERIGWKWDHVLDELEARGWSPPEGVVLDWGCGSGIAGRRVAERFGAPVEFSDRSARAVSFARGRAGGLSLASSEGAPATLVVSHVIGELGEADLDRLVAQAARATSLIWVEPGDRASSRALIGVRERLRGELSVIAPCTHQSACPMLAEGLESDWCHHFARPPFGVFADSGWARFSNELSIDLHSTPLSFLVMDRRPAAALPPGTMHLVGSPRVHKPHVLVYGCDDAGLHGRRLTKRRHPDLYRQAKKGNLDAIAEWEATGDEIVSWNGLPAAEPATDD